jgi:hypothetical protein
MKAIALYERNPSSYITESTIAGFLNINLFPEYLTIQKTRLRKKL